ncbi:MAG: carbon monoxide dehydrogenase [Armatimonadetes bacterium CG2_30_59_28]|nr:AAA family ATPase [Armatimonadota bacterium]OIO96435.1 MAG: carbon monoxide dehydrogenase [Armatimonadetes bacterium CG2_30_59_28]PIU66251.1 MAG: carbon monoxide dehydrogenase [Armatimonadetes bacterium CG07_land_8_20_14_0_80_59_28]PIX45081.1 MAG: carbon monoxide dehydrogenase [Armatimonadetes bacterium CG_4_8_14_3_um_filter_58_9]PIY43801.1 MAG: carbon monoxide dehydrogenase [Armatimonadetes bacterium CG_4_10_14_3_um_filter_59_10]
MPEHISIAGKGGTGKTTLSSLLIRYLCETGKKPVLAVDADPNSNLGEGMGMAVAGTVADVLADIKNPDAIPGGMSKHAYIEYRLHGALTESSDVDLLTMGGPEGAGCYCAPNDILKAYIEKLQDNYSCMVMDNEAGLEHLSRRIAQNMDIMFITSDPTVRGVRSAGRIAQLVKSLKLDYGRLYFVLSRSEEEKARELQPEIEATGLELAAIIPYDPQLADYDARGCSFIDLPADSPSYRAVREMAQQVGL